jgi:hypothetical protein
VPDPNPNDLAAGQAALRARLKTAQDAIAAELQRFEADTGLRVVMCDVTRWDSGGYGTMLRLGGRVAKGGERG